VLKVVENFRVFFVRQKVHVILLGTLSRPRFSGLRLISGGRGLWSTAAERHVGAITDSFVQTPQDSSVVPSPATVQQTGS